MKRPLIDYSIVIPVYFNAGSLKELYQMLKQNVIEKNNDKTCEIIFIDDGSGDNSLDQLLEIKNQDPNRIKIIKFTRNFGQYNAKFAGHEYARGKCIISISADLQDPVEVINLMLDYYFNKNYEIVIATRESREESFYRCFTSRIFYYLIKKLSFSNMPIGGFDFHLISNKVKDIIIKNKEVNALFQGQILWTGYNIKFISYKRKKRKIGKSRWTFRKKLKSFIDAILSYSYFPLRLMSFLGIVIAFFGFFYALIIFLRRLNGVNVQGWATIVILILVLSGFQMLMLGIIGEYLWRTLDQVRKRPIYVIEKIYD